MLSNKTDIQFKKIFDNIVTYFDEPSEKLLFNIILITIFTFIYKFIDYIDNKAFSKRLSTFDSFYFSAISSFTIGYGDIIPKSKLAKIAVIINTLLFWMIAIV